MTTIQEALAEYSRTYRTWRLSQEVSPYNIDVEVQYATQDLFNQVKRHTTENGLYVITDSIDRLKKATR